MTTTFIIHEVKTYPHKETGKQMVRIGWLLPVEQVTEGDRVQLGAPSQDSAVELAAYAHLQNGPGFYEAEVTWQPMGQNVVPKLKIHRFLGPLPSGPVASSSKA